MIERLKALGFTDIAATFLASEIEAGRKTFAKIEFTAQMDLRYVAKINREHEISRTYRVRDVNGIEAVGVCQQLAGYQEDRDDPTWRFSVALPHPDDEGRGVVVNARESAIIEEVA